jgi:uncharacterized membrane protein
MTETKININNMNKNRLEALSDGVFAIVMTLLILEVKIPPLPLTKAEDGYLLWSELSKQAPVFISYFTTFAITTMYWIGHHNLFHLFTKNINRTLMEINMLFLMCVCILPFLSHLIGAYSYNQTALILYSIGVIATGSTMYLMYEYAKRSKEIENLDMNILTLRKIQIRIILPIVCSLLAIGLSKLSLEFSFILLFAPVVFNTIPGSLSFIERFGLIKGR